MTAGLSTTGLTVLTLVEIKDEMEVAFQSLFGTSIDLHASGNFGQIIGILSEREAILWELLELIYASMDPDSATGQALDQLAALTGTIRRDGRQTIAVETLTGDPATTVPENSVIVTDSTNKRFATASDVTLAVITAWVDTTAYVVGNRVYNDTPDRVYLVTVAGTSAGSGGPTGTTSSIADNTVTWRYLGDGTAVGDVYAVAEDNGTIPAVSGDLTEIDTPVSGWGGAINVLDGELGRDEETDAELRVRREAELARSGSSTYNALYAAVFNVADVTALEVYENSTADTDSDGVPGKAFEVVVLGGLDDAIGLAIFEDKPIGILAHGTTTVQVEDDNDIEHDISFTRPEEIDIYVTVTLEYDENFYPSDGDTQVKTAISALSDLNPGHDVVSSRVKAKCFTVAGVLDVSIAYIDTSASPSSETTVAINTRQLAVYDTTRTNVNSSSATP